MCLYCPWDLKFCFILQIAFALILQLVFHRLASAIGFAESVVPVGHRLTESSPGLARNFSGSDVRRMRNRAQSLTPLRYETAAYGLRHVMLRHPHL